jgi:alpha-glucosidase
MSLPGGVYIYQGEELGLPEVEDLPDEVRQDPVFSRTHGADPGRDGCRVPLPWAGDAAPYDFGGDDTWLPQPGDWARYTVAAESADEDSMLRLYQKALRLRRELPALGDGTMTWLPSADGVLAFTRDDHFTCVVNLSDGPVDLPDHTEVLLASGPLADGRLPPDTTAWLNR